MKRNIVDFSKDDDGHWRARLECGHYQHVRHDPPLRSREWVLTEAGRSSRLGMSLECKKCDVREPLIYDRNS
jgi:hypothetical protein